MVGVPFLETISQFDVEQSGELSKADDEVFFVGKIGDHGFLAGVEETEHTHYRHKHPQDTLRYKSGAQMSMAAYDARDDEFEALGYQKRAAEEECLPQETTDFLQKRIDDATQFRQAGA